jgi:hypothetical protein
MMTSANAGALLEQVVARQDSKTASDAAIVTANKKSE